MSWHRRDMMGLRCISFGLLIVVAIFGYHRIIADIYLFEAEAYVKRGDWPNALTSASGAARANYCNTAPLHILGMAFIYTGNVSRGIDNLEEYLKANPYDLIPLVNFGIVNVLIGEDDIADRTRARVEFISPEYAKMIK